MTTHFDPRLYDDSACLPRGPHGITRDPIQEAVPARLPAVIYPAMTETTKELAARIADATKRAAAYGVEPVGVTVTLDPLTYEHLVRRLEPELWPRGRLMPLAPPWFVLGSVKFERRK